MKFPLSERIVPALALSAVERQHYEKMAHALVDDTIAQYDEYDRVYHRQVNREQWKAVKKREHLTVYKERKVARPKVMLEQQQQSYTQTSGTRSRFSTATISSASSSAGERSGLHQNAVLGTRTPFASTSKWTVPTLFMVGTIVGTLDDVMYGVATFDGPSMLLKTTYTHDELADGEILNEIHGPTAEDPYRFLGVKWIVKGNPPAVSKFVRPRDLVFLEATGVREGPRGDRIGYHLMHSLDLPEYGPLQGKAKEILRGRVSSCIVFKQLANGTVDVYMKANFEPNGKVTEPVAVLSAANGLIYCWRSVHCAQHKKLAWLLAKSERKRRRELGSAASAADLQNLSTKCNTCSKSPHAFRQMTPCPLCAKNMCPMCRVPKKISYVGDAKAKLILQKPVPFCKHCISGASQLSAFEVAKDEVLSGMWTPGGGGSSSNSMGHRTASVFEASASIETTGHVSLGGPSSSLQQDLRFHEWSASLIESDSDDLIGSNVDEYTKDDVRLSTSALEALGAPTSSSQAAEARGVELVTLEKLGQQQPQQQPQPPRPMGSSQEELYMRIAQLRDRAESIYQTTLHTAVIHLGGSGSNSPRGASVELSELSSKSSEDGSHAVMLRS